MRQSIVLDACTIINLLRIDFNDQLYNKITSMDIHISECVINEVKRNVFRSSIDTETKENISQLLPSFLKFQTKDDVIINDLLSLFDDIKEYSSHKKHNNGELLSIALAFRNSRLEDKTFNFYTDDFIAKKQYRHYYKYQQIGIIGDSVDLILSFHLTDKDFELDRICKMLTDLASEYNLPLRQFINEIEGIYNTERSRKRKPDTNLLDHLNKIISCYNSMNIKGIKEEIDYFDNNKRKYGLICEVIEKYRDLLIEIDIVKKIHITTKNLKKIPLWQYC